MNVFVLCAGRTGSKTFAKSAAHLPGYTAGHETRSRAVFRRLAYPDQHIEVDNRLVWFLGMLDAGYPGARYVHLTRDVEACARSHAERIGTVGSIVRGWRDAVLMGGRGAPLDVCRQYVENANANIRCFLQSRPHVTVRLECAQEDFARVGELLEAEVPEASIREWDTVRR